VQSREPGINVKFRLNTFDLSNIKQKEISHEE
jgi:hypothetical protein